MNKIFILLVFVLIVSACKKNDYVPKPAGYFRIDLPEKVYQTIEGELPFSFEYPVYSVLEDYKGASGNNTWKNINFPQYKATIHLSYEKTTGDPYKHLEEARKLAYKHTVKADAITEKTYFNTENKVYGILYDIKGDAASSVQFFLTDSTSQFFRGALYFKAEPNKDSLRPVIEFFREDILHLMETFEWK